MNLVRTMQGHLARASRMRSLSLVELAIPSTKTEKCSHEVAEKSRSDDFEVNVAGLYEVRKST